MTALSAPVGKPKKTDVLINRPDDVRLVKKLLNKHVGQLGLKLLDENKVECDTQTIKAIEAFQLKILRLKKSGRASIDFDGRVDPNDETFLALSRAETKTLSKRPVIDKPQQGLILAQKNNQPGRQDATGAFHIGARAFCRLYGLKKPILIDNAVGLSAKEKYKDYEKRCRATYKEIDGSESPLDVIAFFGHGTPNGLPSFGLFSSDINTLAEKIRKKCKDRCAILLYACSAGALGGFAEKLANMINSGGSTTKDCRVVYGHLIDGHTFLNPYYTYFPGREYVVIPGTSIFNSWVKAINNNSLWARFPFMSDEELHKEISQKSKIKT